MASSPTALFPFKSSSRSRLGLSWRIGDRERMFPAHRVNSIHSRPTYHESIVHGFDATHLGTRRTGSTAKH